MGLKTCIECGNILTTDEYEKGFDYCYSCYKDLGLSSSKTSGLKRCKLCGEILTTEEFNNGYDYHLNCYLKIKGKHRY